MEWRKTDCIFLRCLQLWRMVFLRIW
uniref:Uncharacterized protein n=1 Tax=Arundo donax TaxID=35708 RepID=A0A0A9HKR7_ARUDO